MKCPYCRTIQRRQDDPEQRMTFITCKCPGNVIVEVWMNDEDEDA